MRLTVTVDGRELVTESRNLQAPEPTERVHIVLKWEGGAIATLKSLRDNSVLVPIPLVRATGRIEIEYQSPRTGAHHIECQVDFIKEPGKQRTAIGSVNNGREKSLGAMPNEYFWMIEGDIS